MSEKKYYTIEEAKAHGREYIEKQAEILRKNLREKRKSNTEEYA